MLDVQGIESKPRMRFLSREVKWLKIQEWNAEETRKADQTL